MCINERQGHVFLRRSDARRARTEIFSHGARLTFLGELVKLLDYAVARVNVPHNFPERHLPRPDRMNVRGDGQIISVSGEMTYPWKFRGRRYGHHGNFERVAKSHETMGAVRLGESKN